MFRFFDSPVGPYLQDATPSQRLPAFLPDDSRPFAKGLEAGKAICPLIYPIGVFGALAGFYMRFWRCQSGGFIGVGVGA